MSAIKGQPSWNKGGTSWSKGRHLSEEHRRKIGLALSGRKGRIHTEKEKKRISLALIGRKFSEESKEKMRKNNARYWLGKKASIESRKKMNEAQKRMGNHPPPYIQRGENCHFWKGGITPENKKVRTSLEMKLWRRAVFERDNFICQKYGIKGGRLAVHHINNFADFPELRLAIDNGVTLSERAHIEFHKKYGKKNNTKEQLGEFLS